MSLSSVHSLRVLAVGLALLTGSIPAVLAETLPTPPVDGAQAQVPVESFELDNGMRFLTVHKPEMTTVSGAWVAHVGSANEVPGITGLAHLFEHMLFKGTHTLGTTNIGRDLEIIAEQEQLQDQIRDIYREQRRRYRLGEVEDPFGSDRPAELEELTARFQTLVEEQRALMIKDEFDQIYTEAGGSGMNAFTNQDMTGYFITVPANKLELWFWMESDRLANPVFREFYSERDVVHEERRMRTESTPTGKYDELLNSMFWQSHPYSWPIVGWPSDLRVISMEQAQEFYDTYYAPNNLTGVLVGNFEPAEVRNLAEQYFGRLQRGTRPPADVVTLEMPQIAEKRMLAECDCQPQVSVQYHSVPFRHRDSYALDVMANLLNGQTGRLYKSLVLDQGIASSVSAAQNSMKYAGAFAVNVEAKGDASPEELEQAWYRELTRLQEEPVAAEELQKVKNQIQANAFRRLDNSFFLLLQLLFYDGMGDWTYLDDWDDLTLAVTAEDVMRVAKQYFAPENRVVGLYDRKAGTQAAELPPELEALPAEMRPMVQAQLQQVRQLEDVAQLQQIAAQLEAQRAQVPPEMAPVIDLMARAVAERIDELNVENADQESNR